MEGGGRHMLAFVPLRPSPLTVCYVLILLQNLLYWTLRLP